jgi:hypothetical protein
MMGTWLPKTCRQKEYMKKKIVPQVGYLQRMLLSVCQVDSGLAQTLTALSIGLLTP